MSDQISTLTNIVKDLQREVQQLAITVSTLAEVVEGALVDGTAERTTLPRQRPAPTNAGVISCSVANCHERNKPCPLVTAPASPSAPLNGIGSAAATALRRARLSESLFKAVREQKTEDICKFLADGADVSYKPPILGHTVLHQAVELGDTGLVLLLLDAGAPLEAKCDIGETPLHWAARTDHTECMQVIIGCGADINAKNVNGWTPIHVASHLGHAACVRLLLYAGADKSIKTLCGYAPKDFATGRVRDLFK